MPEPQRNMAQRATQHFMSVLFNSDFEYAELQSPVAKVLWGLWLLRPTWETFGGLRAYDTMTHLAPEGAWGIAFFLAGVLHLLVIAAGHFKARLWMANGGVFIWTAVAVMFARTSISSTGVPIYLLLAFGAAWSSWRLEARRKSGDE